MSSPIRGCTSVVDTNEEKMIVQACLHGKLSAHWPSNITASGHVQTPCPCLRLFLYSPLYLRPSGHV